MMYDVITIDPPPPLEAAASSLLYSEEFYRVARRKLRPGGILQQWLPTTIDDDPVDIVRQPQPVHCAIPFLMCGHFRMNLSVHFL